MKKGIHPNYHEKATTVCVCGNKIVTGSTEKAMQVEVCSACHPYYTGKYKLVDVAGRIDQFKQRVEKAKLRQKRKGSAETNKADKKKRKEDIIKLG